MPYSDRPPLVPPSSSTAQPTVGVVVNGTKLDSAVRPSQPHLRRPELLRTPTVIR